MNNIKVTIQIGEKAYSREYKREAAPTLATLQHDLDRILLDLSAEINKDYPE